MKDKMSVSTCVYAVRPCDAHLFAVTALCQAAQRVELLHLLLVGGACGETLIDAALDKFGKLDVWSQLVLGPHGQRTLVVLVDLLNRGEPGLAGVLSDERGFSQ